MTRSINYICTLLVLLTMMASCQKVIELDLKDSEQRYIIDALITDEVGNNAISITQSKSFYESSVYDSVLNAKIWVKNTTTNQEFEFLLNSQNVFTNATIVAIPGNNYALTVVIGADTFSGQCKVPLQKVIIEDIKVEKSEFSIFAGKDIFVGVPIYQDPVGRGNNYLLRSYLNGRRTLASDIDTDDFIDGQLNKSSISFRELDADLDDPEFFPGDELMVELINIDKPVYEFYSTLSQNSSAAISNPANPISNIFGKNVLGVFNVGTISRVSVIAQY